MYADAILEKRTSESVLYDINCSFMLDPLETISSVTSISADQVGLTIGTGAINATQITYSDGAIAAIGTVIQVRISGGSITAGATKTVYTIRAVFVTSTGNIREASVQLKVTDTPS